MLHWPLNMAFYPVTWTASVLQLSDWVINYWFIQFFPVYLAFHFGIKIVILTENGIISATGLIYSFVREFPVARELGYKVKHPFPNFMSTSDRCREYNGVMLAWYRVRRKSWRWARQHWQQQQLARETRSTGVSRDTQTCWRHNEAKRLAANTRRHAAGQWPGVTSSRDVSVHRDDLLIYGVTKAL